MHPSDQNQDNGAKKKPAELQPLIEIFDPLYQMYEYASVDNETKKPTIKETIIE